MVDLGEIQAAYYMVAATGVLVAAVYYVYNMRETTKNRRATFSNSMIQTTLTKEWQLQSMEVMNMQWSGFEDFKRKYDSSVNLEGFAKRQSCLITEDAIGRMYRQGTINLDAFGSASGLGVVLLWLKFRPIIEGYRGWQAPKDYFSDLEYLANALQKRLSESDPEFMKKANAFLMTPSMDQ